MSSIDARDILFGQPTCTYMREDLRSGPTRLYLVLASMS